MSCVCCPELHCHALKLLLPSAAMLTVVRAAMLNSETGVKFVVVNIAKVEVLVSALLGDISKIRNLSVA